MGVRLIRENSDTPNVTNKDDARMVRYAYGGQNGYVQKYGRELDYIPSDNIFTIGSGMAVLQGWEVVIDSNGWQLELSTSDVTKRYYLVYLEVNLTLGGSAEIKSKTDELDYPTIEEGDDLTENLNGIARLELYRFTATRGVVADVEKRVSALGYMADALIAIDKRLNNLGFRIGTITVSSDFTADSSYTIKRQGNYVIGRCLLIPSKTPTVIPVGTVLGIVSEDMIPSEDYEPISAQAKLVVYGKDSPKKGQIEVTLISQFAQVTKVEFTFGWEAPPINS